MDIERRTTTIEGPAFGQAFPEPQSERWQHVPINQLNIRLPILEGQARSIAARGLEGYLMQTGLERSDTRSADKLRDNMVAIHHEMNQLPPVDMARLLQLVALGISAADDLQQPRDRHAVTVEGNRMLRRTLDGQRTGLPGVRQRLPDFLPERLRGATPPPLPQAAELLPVLKDWIHSIPYWNGLDDGQVRKNLTRLVAAVTNTTTGSALPTFEQGALMGLIARAGRHVPQATDVVLDWLTVAGRNGAGGPASQDYGRPSAIVGLAEELPFLSTRQAIATLDLISQTGMGFSRDETQTLRVLLQAAADVGGENSPEWVLAYEGAQISLNLGGSAGRAWFEPPPPYEV